MAKHAKSADLRVEVPEPKTSMYVQFIVSDVAQILIKIILHAINGMVGQSPMTNIAMDGTGCVQISI